MSPVTDLSAVSISSLEARQKGFLTVMDLQGSAAFRWLAPLLPFYAARDPDGGRCGLLVSLCST